MRVMYNKGKGYRQLTEEEKEDCPHLDEKMKNLGRAFCFSKKFRVSKGKANRVIKENKKRKAELKIYEMKMKIFTIAYENDGIINEGKVRALGKETHLELYKMYDKGLITIRRTYAGEKIFEIVEGERSRVKRELGNQYGLIETPASLGGY